MSYIENENTQNLFESDHRINKEKDREYYDNIYWKVKDLVEDLTEFMTL